MKRMDSFLSIGLSHVKKTESVGDALRIFLCLSF